MPRRSPEVKPEIDPEGDCIEHTLPSSSTLELTVVGINYILEQIANTQIGQIALQTIAEMLRNPIHQNDLAPHLRPNEQLVFHNPYNPQQKVTFHHQLPPDKQPSQYRNITWQEFVQRLIDQGIYNPQTRS